MPFHRKLPSLESRCMYLLSDACAVVFAVWVCLKPVCGSRAGSGALGIRGEATGRHSYDSRAARARSDGALVRICCAMAYAVVAGEDFRDAPEPLPHLAQGFS